MNRTHPQGITVSLADICVAYVVVFNEAHPQDLPFAEGAERVKAARPKSWVKLFARCQAARTRLPFGTDYAVIAQAVKADIEAAIAAKAA